MSSTYTVKKGDRLSRIARAHGISLSELRKANPHFWQNGRDPDLIYPGEQVTIPTKSSFSSITNLKTGEVACKECCEVIAGPTYNPAGTITATMSGGRKRATFNMESLFKDVAPHIRPSCCEVRQYIKWDSVFHTWRGGPPHSGFPATATANTWYEDRDSTDKRYGHRSGSHSDPITGCGDEYLDAGGSRDQTNGSKFCGRDNPSGPLDLIGQWQFQIKVIDTCRSEQVIASSRILTINW